MTNISTVAGTYKVNFWQGVHDLLAAEDATKDVQVIFGAPISVHDNDFIAFLDLDTDQDPASFGSNRSRDEVLELDLLFSCFRPGGQDAELEAHNRIYELVGLVERWARMTNTTISSSVRECFLVRTRSNGFTPKEMARKGRNLQLVATFQAKARISS